MRESSDRVDREGGMDNFEGGVIMRTGIVKEGNDEKFINIL